MEVKNKIVIFGGSFNPPLNSHFAIAEQVLNQYEQVDKVISEIKKIDPKAFINVIRTEQLNGMFYKRPY